MDCGTQNEEEVVYGVGSAEKYTVQYMIGFKCKKSVCVRE